MATSERKKKPVLDQLSKCFRSKWLKATDNSPSEHAFQENISRSESETCTSHDDVPTWPPKRLQDTVECVLKDFMSDFSSEQMESIVKDIEEKVNIECPLNIKQQFDFCMICSQYDYTKAVEIKEYLCSQYDLSGQVIWDSVPLGSNLFSVFEDMVTRSTKLLFYVTEHFDDSDACALIAKNQIVFRDIEGAERKVIPLVDNFNTPIPDTFKLVDKLYLSSDVQFKYRLPVIFTPQLKQEKLSRMKSLWKQADKTRRAFILNAIRKKLDLK